MKKSGKAVKGGKGKNQAYGAMKPVGKGGKKK